MQDETLKDKQIKWNKNHFSTALNRMVCMNVKHRNPLIKKINELQMLHFASFEL